MKLERIYLSRDYVKTTFSGKVSFKGELGEVDLKISAEDSEKIIALCAEQLVKTSKTLAEEMTIKCIDVQTQTLNLIER